MYAHTAGRRLMSVRAAPVKRDTVKPNTVNCNNVFTHVPSLTIVSMRKGRPGNANKPGSADEVKTGNFISYGGTFSSVKLTAKECLYGESK